MANVVSEDDIAKLMEAFSRFDTDRDGLIGTEELRKVLRHLGHNPTDAELQGLKLRVLQTQTNLKNPEQINEYLNQRVARQIWDWLKYVTI